MSEKAENYAKASHNVWATNKGITYLEGSKILGDATTYRIAAAYVKAATLSNEQIKAIKQFVLGSGNPVAKTTTKRSFSQYSTEAKTDSEKNRRYD